MSITHFSDTLNSELDKVLQWLSMNKLLLNITKTKYMIFHYRQRKLKPSDIPTIVIDNKIIDRVSSFDFLGITLQENLSWKEHTNKIAMKISRTIGIMGRLKRILPSKILKLIYNSLILSYLNYGIILWGFDLGRLPKLQKKALRIITKSKYNAHTAPLLKKENLLTVGDIFEIQCLKLYFKIINNKVPSFFGEIMNSTVTHNYPLRSGEFRIPHTNTRTAENRIRVYLPRLINNTPSIITDKIHTHSLGGFARYIKITKINNYPNVCTISNCYICNNA